VLIEKDGTERLYFVVETKGSLFKDDLRGIEGGKIQCGKAHFKALAEGDDPARYIVATQLDDLMMAK
jgi:type III restriction enzyme